jgi:adenylate cyclase
VADPVQRRLAAILAADVAGYSRLMGDDEEGTRARFNSHLAELIEPTIASRHGRIVKTTGDALLVEFASVVDAVQCAVDVQKGMVERNAGEPDNHRMEFRIGVNLGDVIIEGDDIHGDGVNVASRLEGLAEPGRMCVSASVYDQVRNRIELAFEDLGEQQVKNIDRPVRVWQWVADATALATGAGQGIVDTSHLGPDKPSIAVLPFNNLSGDPEQEYFSDGMAEDLITDISKISGLLVIARNSSFAFKGQAIDVKEIAAKLSVKHVLEGSVRKMGAKLRVNAQLIDTASGGHIWAERYDGDMAEIFEFQDDIRGQIVSALQVSLTPADKALTERKSTESVEAYDLFLRGRAIHSRYARDDLLEAIKCLEAAIEIDPNFADAYSYLSFCHFLGWAQVFPGLDENLERAHELAERSVALDSTSAIALAHLGWVQAFLRRYDPAVANCEKAIALAPTSADVYADCGHVFNYLGDPQRALEMIEKAFDLETFAPALWQYFAGVSHFLLRQYNEAIARLDQSVEQVPMLHSYTYLACAYVELGRCEDARRAIDKVLEIAPRFTLEKAARRYVFRIDEVRARMLDNLRKAGLPE